MRWLPACGVLVGLIEALAIDAAYPVAQESWRRAAFFGTAMLVDGLALFLPLLLLGWAARRRRTAGGVGIALLAVSALVVSWPLLSRSLPARQGSAPATNDSQRPSILLVTIDTLRQDHVSAYGKSPVRTPVMDAVAADGALFLDAYCQAPLTTPSHASLLSSVLPPMHGSRYNGVPARITERALAPTLRANGYRTAAFVSGSVLTAGMSGLAFGFDTYDDDLLPDPGSQQIYRLSLARWAARILHRKQPEQRARITIERAVSFLDREGSKAPLFLWAHIYDPHIPYSPPRAFRRQADPDYRGTFEVDRNSVVAVREGKLHPSERDLDHGRRMYAAEVAYVDACLGPLLGAVQRCGRPFLIAIASDHGESLGEHHYLFFHGENLFSPSMRVPLVLQGPGIPRGARVRDLVRLTDLMPTILDLVGVAVPDGLAGRSLVPMLRGQPLPPASSYGEDGDLLFLAPATSHVSLEGKDVGLRTPEWSYVIRPSKGVEQLYDLSADPGEQHNVAGDPRHDGVRARMRSELESMTDFASYRPGGSTMPLGDEETRKTLEQLGYVEKPTEKR